MPWHSAIVHYTIALFSISVLLDIIGFLKKNEIFHRAAWFNLIFAGAAAIFTIASGLWSKNNFTIPTSALNTLDIHETLAFIISAFIFALLLWRMGVRGKFPSNHSILYLLLGIIGVFLLVTGAYYGGKLVYRHGVAVRNIQINKQNTRAQREEQPRTNPGDEMYPED